MEKRIGLVLGSFAPPHNGHIGLINFGLSNCDFLYLLLCSHDKEDIPGELRLGWLQEEFKNVNNIKIIHKDTSHMENTSVSNVDISRVWSVYLKDLFPDVNVIFTSEKYGDYVSEFMGIEHMQYDQPRLNTPISSTLIREQPLKYWDFIPKSVRPYYTKKVCIVGTESTGKSTMTKLLSNFYGVPQAREMGREICDDTKTCNIEMLNEIIEAQAVEITENLGDKILFSDTDSLTTICYGKYLFNQVPTTVTNEIEKINDFDIYLFLWNDVPFVDDGSRMGEPHRSEFHQLLYETFKNKNVYYIKGTDFEERFNKCVEIIDNYLENN